MRVAQRKPCLSLETTLPGNWRPRLALRSAAPRRIKIFCSPSKRCRRLPFLAPNRYRWPDERSTRTSACTSSSASSMSAPCPRNTKTTPSAIPNPTGDRSRESHYDPAAHFETGDDVSLFVQDGKLRPDWLVLNVSALAAPDERAAAIAIIAPTVTSQNPLPASAGTAKPSTSAPPSIEERLRRLKHLREQDLISEEEYNRKRSEILDQL